jgi:hypothetical protein
MVSFAGLLGIEDIGTIKNYPVNLDVNQQQLMSTYSPQTTYSPTYTLPNVTLTPSMQYNPQFLINSAGASATGGSITPSVTPSQIISPTITPTQTTTPTQSQKADATATGGAGGGMDWTTIAIIGAVVVGAYLIFGGKKGKENRGRVKSYAKKGARYAVMKGV